MGCYDYVRFQDEDYVLPDGLIAGKHIFQTKDGGCSFMWFDILSNGLLLVDDMIFTGEISLSFYTMQDDRVWHEYDAYFRNGRLQSIGVVL